MRSSWWVVPAPSVARSTTTARESVSDVMQSLQLMMVSQSYTTLLYLTMHTCMYNVNESLYIILCVFVRFIRWGFLVILPPLLLVCYTHTCTCNMYMYLHCRLSMYKVHVHVHVEYSTCTCRVQYMYMSSTVHVHVEYSTCVYINIYIYTVYMYMYMYNVQCICLRNYVNIRIR